MTSVTAPRRDEYAFPTWKFLAYVLAAFGMLALGICSAQSPQCSVANTSSKRQVRWCTVPMPLSQAAALPAACMVDGRYLAVKAERLGAVTQLWHVRCDVQGHGTLAFSSWQPLPAGAVVPPFELSSWVADAPAREGVWYSISTNGQWRLNLEMRGGAMVSQSPAAQTWEFRASYGGYHAVTWVTYWSGQDAVDVEGCVVWSDPTSTAWSVPNVNVALQVGYWGTVGEPVAITLEAKLGFQRWSQSSGSLYSGPLPHGSMVTWRGTILPQDDAPVPVTAAQQAQQPAAEWRRSMVEAAREGPLVGAAKWNGEWLAFGVVPATAERAVPSAVRAELSQAGKLYDRRPLANGDNHGGTGMQPPFGATKDLVTLQGDPWRLWLVWYSADDYCRRAFHHRELDGRRTTKTIRPGLQTWMGTIEPREGPDTFGKPGGPNNYAYANNTDKVGTWSIFADDQHRSDGYLVATYALTGSRLLRECMLDVLAADEMRAYPARSYPIEAPRASGRLWQSWAKCCTLFEGAERDRYCTLALAELAERERDQAEWNYSPLTTMQVVDDTRILGKGVDAIVPWNVALGTMGALECAAAFARIGRSADAERFRAYARKLGRSLTEWSWVQNGPSGPLIPIVGQKWLAGGAANPPAYYVFPRDGAGLPGPGVDMLVEPNVYWTPWFAGALAAAQLPPLDAVSERAAGIWSANAPGSTGYNLEWWACR